MEELKEHLNPAQSVPFTSEEITNLKNQVINEA